MYQDPVCVLCKSGSVRDGSPEAVGWTPAVYGIGRICGKGVLLHLVPLSVASRVISRFIFCVQAVML